MPRPERRTTWPELQLRLASAAELGARAVWCQTPSDEAREAVEAAGATYVGEPSIVDAVRALRA